MAIKTFTTGEVLTASDTNTYLANSGLVYITEAAISATALDGIFTSTYDDYRIVLQDCYFSTSGGLIQFKYRDTSNATVSLTNYQSATLRLDSTGTAFNFGNNGQTQADTGVNVSTSVAASFSMDIYGPRLARPTTSTLSGQGIITGVSMIQNSTLYNANTAMAGIIFNTTAGAFANGRIFVYGYRKA